MKLPPTYDCPAALARVSKGLVELGCEPGHARWAAQTALDETPFTTPTEDGWKIACQRARFLAGAVRPDESDYTPCPDGIRPPWR